MRTPDDRWAELAAAALAGELNAREALEFAELRDSDPARAREYAELEQVVLRLRQGDLAWTAPRDVDDLGARIEASVPRDEPQTAAAEPAMVPRASRRWLPPVAAAACLVVGLVVGLNAPGLLSPVPVGPPGTLGAVEPVDVNEDIGGVQVDADVVAHTWGTEAYLEATGLRVGATYELVFVGGDGSEFSAGEILGSEVPIVCRMNAAILRDDAVRMELRDSVRTVVAHADLPAV